MLKPQYRTLKGLKKLWYQGECLPMVQILDGDGESPWFLLCETLTHEVCEDGTHPKAYYAVEPGNEDCYPDTAKVRRLMAARKNHEGRIKMINQDLQKIWMNMFID